MVADDTIEKNTDLKERIKSIKNIGYFAYNKEIIVCSVVFSCIIIFVMAIVIEQLIIVVSVAVVVVLLSTSIVVLYLYFNKEYFIELENGKILLVVGGFRRFRKYYINNTRYIVKNGKIEKTTAKKDIFINLLFTEMVKGKIVKKVSGNQEIFVTEQTNEHDCVSNALGGYPMKHATMTFVNSKFKSGYYVSSKKSSHIHFYVVNKNIKCNDIVPKSILNILEEM